ncbi:MAG: magnesium transporter [Planctomycetota bacterium]
MNDPSTTEPFGPANTKPWEQLEECLDRGDGAEAGPFLERIGYAEAARSLSRLDRRHRERLLSCLEPEAAAELLEHLPDAESASMLESTEPEVAASVFEELSSDTQADVLVTLQPENAEALLAALDPVVADAAIDLAKFAPDTAGGLMVREFLSYDQRDSAAQIVNDLRSRIGEVEDYAVQYIYVTGPRAGLVGVLRLRDLLFARNMKPASELMIGDPLSVRTDATLDDLADLFEARSFLGIPVLDESFALVGVVHKRDVDAALDERAESSRMRAQGIVGGEELRFMPLRLRSVRRLSWLSVNILLNLAAASVIAMHQDTLQSVIVLAVFLPMISDMSGCSGNQAVAVSMRELTLGIVRPIDVLYVWRKELQVGLVNGAALGVLVGLLAWAWQGDPMLGVVVGVALAVNTLVAVSIGGVVPLLLQRFKVDPALASGPILTTLTDVCGFLLALTLASAILT